MTQRPACTVSGPAHDYECMIPLYQVRFGLILEFARERIEIAHTQHWRKRGGVICRKTRAALRREHGEAKVIVEFLYGQLGVIVTNSDQAGDQAWMPTGDLAQALWVALVDDLLAEGRLVRLADGQVVHRLHERYERRSPKTASYQ